jgi:lysine biosynthesis protein LysW
MSRTRCPNCDATIETGKPLEGALIECSACGVELEVVRKDPFAVDFLEDWQEYDWEK